MKALVFYSFLWGLLLMIGMIGTCDSFEVTGRVVSAQTGRGLRKVEVVAARFAARGDAKPAELVPVEAQVRTDDSGAFKLTLHGDLEGLDKVAVFTRSLLYHNVIAGKEHALPLAGQATWAALADPGVRWLDLTQGPAEVNFALEPKFGEVHSVMVPMRDGVRLALDYCAPSETGRFPVILTRHPYGRSLEDPFELLFLEHGYAVAMEDMRGRYDSEGEALAFFDSGWGERQDGYDTVEWIATQPWCNGKVGTWGASAGACTQNLMAGAAPPHLICQVAIVGTADFYLDTVYPGGAFRKQMIEGWLAATDYPPATLELMLAHPAKDAFWELMDTVARAPYIQTPSLQIGGWFDCFESGPIWAFSSRQHNGGEGARGNQKLIMGPWFHGGFFTTKQGQLEYPETALDFDLNAESLRFYDYWLKGEANGVMDEPPVKYYTLGACGEKDAPGNAWHTAADWPPPASKVKLYLHAGGRLSTQPPVLEEASTSYVSDPHDPVPTLGGQNLNMPSGPFDQRSLEKRPDVLTFTTATFQSPRNITGRPVLHLFASSTAKDTDFVVKLCDVYPDGRSMLMDEGVLRARYHKSFASPELLEPGKIYEFVIPLWDISLFINKGHRLRLDIQSSNFPRYDANPQTGVPYGRPSKVVVATNTIYHEAAHPSWLELPVLRDRKH